MFFRKILFQPRRYFSVLTNFKEYYKDHKHIFKNPPKNFTEYSTQAKSFVYLFSVCGTPFSELKTHQHEIVPYLTSGLNLIDYNVNKEDCEMLAGIYQVLVRAREHSIDFDLSTNFENIYLKNFRGKVSSYIVFIGYLDDILPISDSRIQNDFLSLREETIKILTNESHILNSIQKIQLSSFILNFTIDEHSSKIIDLRLFEASKVF